MTSLSNDPRHQFAVSETQRKLKASADARTETKTLVARQVCLAMSVNWQKLDHKQRTYQLTLAENIIATIERKAKVTF